MEKKDNNLERNRSYLDKNRKFQQDNEEKLQTEFIKEKKEHCYNSIPYQIATSHSSSSSSKNYFQKNDDFRGNNYINRKFDHGYANNCYKLRNNYNAAADENKDFLKRKKYTDYSDSLPQLQQHSNSFQGNYKYEFNNLKNEPKKEVNCRQVDNSNSNLNLNLNEEIISLNNCCYYNTNNAQNQTMIINKIKSSNQAANFTTNIKDDIQEKDNLLLLQRNQRSYSENKIGQPPHYLIVNSLNKDQNHIKRSISDENNTSFDIIKKSNQQSKHQNSKALETKHNSILNQVRKRDDENDNAIIINLIEQNENKEPIISKDLNSKHPVDLEASSPKRPAGENEFEPQNKNFNNANSNLKLFIKDFFTTEKEELEKINKQDAYLKVKKQLKNISNYQKIEEIGEGTYGRVCKYK